MADRRSSTIPKPSEEEKKIKKKAEAMLAKSENNWNKITPEQKEVLNSPTTAHFFTISNHEYKELDEKTSGVGVKETNTEVRIEFSKGKLFVNAADPNNLSWARSTKVDRGSREIQKVNLLALSQKFSATRESLSKDGKVLVSASGSEIKDYDQQFEIWKKKDKEVVPIDFYVSEGRDAARILNYIGESDESVDEDALVLISTEEILLFILFRSARIAEEWLVALKILLKAQNLSYRGTKDEYPSKKKDLVKEILKDKDLRLEPKDNSILLWVVDLEVDSYLYRELKIYFWNRSKEYFLFFIVDMRKPLKASKEVVNEKLKSQNFLCKQLVKNYLNDVKYSRFFLVLQEDFDVSLETKGMNFYRESFINTDDKEFWIIRRRIRKKFRSLVLRDDWTKKRADEKKLADELKAKGCKRKKKNRIGGSKPRVEDRFDVNCSKIKEIHKKISKSVYDEKNQIMKALKILQLQKQITRSKLVRISVFRDEKNQFRTARKGKALKIRAMKNLEKADKKACTAASNVLKIMMFEDTFPELIPEQIRSSIKQEDKKRDGCCEIT